jgi:hypothetical protein
MPARAITAITLPMMDARRLMRLRGRGFGFRVHQLSLGARRANLVVRHFFVFDGVLAAVRGKPGSLLQTALNNYHCNTEGAGIAPERGA